MSTAFFRDTDPANAPMHSLSASSIASPGVVSTPLADMYALKQWVMFRLENRSGNRTKVPYNARTGERAKSNAPDTWSTYEVAKAASAKTSSYDGIMFIVSQDDPYTVVDLDDVRDLETGVIAPWAMQLVNEFNTYTEISVSGRGLHIIGHGKKIHNRCRNWKHEHGRQIEVYEWGRPLTVSEDVLTGFDTIRDIQEPLDRFITEHWIQHLNNQVTPRLLADPGMLTLASEEIVDLASRHNSKFRDLYDHGDLSHYGNGHSEADAALCAILAWYTKDPAQILEIWQSSALYRDKTDRKDYTDRTIEAALQLVTGHYDPNYRRRSTTSILVADDPEIAKFERDELLRLVRSQAALIEEERAMRVAAEQRAQRAERMRTGVHAVLRNGDLNAGPRLTAFALAMDLNARIANGEQPGESGFRAPAARYADATGQSTQTVAKHLRELDSKGLITKALVREETRMDDLDLDTGEIVVLPGKRDVNYIQVPENDVIKLIERIATYRRPDGEGGQHGGARQPRPVCNEHPNAGTYTVRHEHIECAECGDVLQSSDPKRTYHAPGDDDAEASGIHLIRDIPRVTNVYSGINLIGEESEQEHSNIKLVSDIPLMPTCDWHLGDGEECGNPTQRWETGFGSTRFCHKHAERAHKFEPAPTVITLSRVLQGGSQSNLSPTGTEGFTPRIVEEI